MTLEGVPQLRRRLKAIATITKPTGGPSGPTFAEVWQEKTVGIAQQMVPVRTGRTRKSIRPGKRRGQPSVVALYTVNFIDAGSKAHVEPRQFSRFTPTGRISRRKRGSGKTLMFQGSGGGTFFRKKVNKPPIAAHPFKKEARARGLREARFAVFLTNLWNRAA